MRPTFSHVLANLLVRGPTALLSWNVLPGQHRQQRACHAQVKFDFGLGEEASHVS